MNVHILQNISSFFGPKFSRLKNFHLMQKICPCLHKVLQFGNMDTKLSKSLFATQPLRKVFKLCLHPILPHFIFRVCIPRNKSNELRLKSSIKYGFHTQVVHTERCFEAIFAREKSCLKH